MDRIMITFRDARSLVCDPAKVRVIQPGAESIPMEDIRKGIALINLNNVCYIRKCAEQDDSDD